ncbi:MAG: SAM-dependent methyltransferase, partial [Acidimicrobiales bacterium]
MSGLVSFVGAGPGAPDLITLRGAERLAMADVVVWASSLVPEALLAHASPAAEIHDSAAMT